MIERPDLPLGNVYNEKGYLLSTKTEDGKWSEYTYLDKDDGEKCETSCKTYTGYWRTTTYNDQFNPLELNDSNGMWAKTVYDDEGREVKFTHSDGHWHLFQYDKNGNQTIFRKSDGREVKFVYDHNGNPLTEEHTDGYWAKWSYHDDGELDTYADSQGKDSGYYSLYLYWRLEAENSRLEIKKLEEELKQLKCSRS